MRTPSVYVASPLGFTAAGRRWLAEACHPALEDAGFAILDPWADPDGTVAATLALPADDPGRMDALRAMNAELGGRNATSIAESDAVLAILDGSDVDSGTSAEIGYAAGIGVPVVGLRTDSRISGDNDATTINLQVAYFVGATGGAVATDLTGAVAALTECAAERHLFHLARRTAWAAAEAGGAYTASTRDESLAEIGFIHCSFERQLAATSRRHYADLDPDELILLVIDRRRLSSRLVVERAPSVDDEFPHIYGPLNLDAVVARHDVGRDAGGSLGPIS